MREYLANFADQCRELRRAVGGDVAGDAAGHDGIHHQPVAEAGFGRAQDSFAQDSALRMHDRERSIVADRADVAEMIGQPLQLRHQRAQVNRARRHLDLQRRLGGLREGDRIGDRAVARGAAGKACRLLQRRARHQRFDALVRIAEPLFQPHHVLAVGGEAEMARLDDAGMHRADRNLVQRVAFAGQELVGLALSRRGALAERVAALPDAMIEPGPRVGRAVGFEAKEIADRAFEPQRRRMPGARRSDRRHRGIRKLRRRFRRNARPKAPCAPPPCRPTGRAGSLRPPRACRSPPASRLRRR